MLCCITLLAESFLGDSQKPRWIGIGSLSEWRWPRTLQYSTGTKIGECHVRLPYTLLAVGTTTRRRRRRRYKQKLQPRARHNISSSFVSARGWKQKLQRRRCFLLPPENNQPTSMRTSSGSDSSTSASGSSTSAIMVVVLVLVAVKLLLRASTTS